MEIAVFNAPTQLFGTLSLHFTATPEGVLKPTHRIWTSKLYNFASAGDFYTVLSEVLYVVMLFFLARETYKNMKRYGCDFLRSFSNILDVAVLLTSVVGIILFFFKISTVEQNVSNTGSRMNYSDILNASISHYIIVYVLAIDVALVYVKFVTAMEFHFKIRLLVIAIWRSTPKLIGYSLLFSLYLMTYTTSSNLMLYSMCEEFSTLTKTTPMLISVMLGNIQFSKICILDQLIYWVFRVHFVMFTFLIFAIWMPLIQAILIRALRESKDLEYNQYYMDMVHKYLVELITGFFVCGTIPSRTLKWKKVELCEKSVTKGQFINWPLFTHNIL